MSVTAARVTVLQLLHLLHPLLIAPHNIPNMSYPVEIHLQCVNLRQYVVKSRNLGIWYGNRIASPVVLLLCHHL